MKILRTILVLFHTAVVGLLCIMLMNRWLPAALSTYPNLLSLAFPVLIFAHILLCLFWIVLWKKRAFLFLMASVLFFNATRRWINFTPKEKPGHFKVLTMNTKGGRMGQTALSMFLKDYRNYDLVLLQEDYTEPFNNSADFRLIKICTPHRIIKQGQILDSGENGNACFADINVRGKIIRVINVYLEPFHFDKEMIKPAKNADANQEKAKNIIKKLLPTFRVHQHQVRQIRQAVAESPYPVILAGDLNSVPNSYEYFNLVKDLDDAFLTAGRGSATTFHDYKFPIRIDYIFTSPSVRAKTYTVDRSVHHSDHYPVTATFDLE